jgi:isopenicillin-N N-acyltransferase-like protein
MAPEHRDRLPIIELSGGPRDRGLAHGEGLRDLIAHGLELWLERLPTHGASAQQTIDDFLNQSGHLRAAQEWTPNVVDEVRGIADGAGIPFETLFAYNLADEQQIFLDGPRNKCTTVGIRAGADGVPISGQTMDTPGWFADTRVALSIHEEETGLDILAFTIAGIVVLCGVNSAGVSVWCNAVYQLANSPHGLPVACVARATLSQPTIGQAEQFIRSVSHASGQNYLVGSPDGVISLECSARSVAATRLDGNAVWHTNHPLGNLDRIDSSVDENSIDRDRFAGSRLQRAARISELQDILSDRTTPVCKVSVDDDEFGYTVWGVVVEHLVPPRVHATPGPPALLPWQVLPFRAERMSTTAGA